MQALRDSISADPSDSLSPRDERADTNSGKSSMLTTVQVILSIVRLAITGQIERLYPAVTPTCHE